MAGLSLGGRNEPQAEPNVVPMIDILLVLLIIFMITQPLSRMAIDIQVPPQDTPESAPQTPPTQIVLELPAAGGYAINGMRVPTKDELDSQLRAIYAQRPAKVMFIAADPNRIYQEVVEAIDIARGAGVQLVGFTPQEAK